MIRHGETKGNRERRYVGTTDEGLLPDAAEQLSGRKMPRAARIYVSPMRRCRETAALLYPGQDLIMIEAFRECDFGEFEYKNYGELNGNAAYQRFIDTLGESGFPGGEDMKSFQRRCVMGFEEVLRREEDFKGRQRDVRGRTPGTYEEDIALVIHGGTIMAILDYFSRPHRDYYDWQVRNGCGYAARAARDGTSGSWSLQQIREIGQAGSMRDELF